MDQDTVSVVRIEDHRRMDTTTAEQTSERGLDHEVRLCEEQVRAVYEALPLSIFVNVVTGTALAISLHAAVSVRQLGTWLALLFFVQLLRWGSLRIFISERPSGARIRAWVRIAVGGAVASGLVWGLASLFLWSATDPARQALMMIVIAGMVSGGITTLAPILSAAVSFMYCAVVPLIWRLSDIGGGGESSLYLLFMSALFLVMMTITARRSNALLVDSLITQIEKERAEETVRYQASYDELTDLPNRRFLVSLLKRELSRSQRHDWIGALFFLDIDHFKDINDTLGHDSGDKLLQLLARRITSRLRVEDMVSRLGGDEFVLVFPELTEDKEQALLEVDRLAKDIIGMITAPFTINGHEISVTASVGVALMPTDGRTPEELLKHADTAMYRAKESGRNGYQVFMADMQRAIQLRLDTERELRHAIASNQLRVHYQPQVDHLGTIRSLEALVRWEHPQRGLVLPNEFIRVAEQTGLVVQLSRWLLTQVFNDLKLIKQALPPAQHPSITVNISANDFRHNNLLGLLRNLASTPGFLPGDFRLELTEHTVMENYDGVIDTMNAAKRLGFSFAIDDFGTGHSSLAYLKCLPVSVLKIDKSFVKEVIDSPNDAVIVQTILGMAENLGLDTIAEGVESKEVYEALRRLGCRYFQGWHFGPPEPLEKIVRRMEQGRRVVAKHNIPFPDQPSPAVPAVRS